jgi:glutathione synthase/RimK-type ligase-like ATP-grasp enzyme
LIIIRHPEDWLAPDLSPHRRIGPAPRDLLRHLEQTNGSPARAATGDEAFSADVIKAMAELPAIVLAKLQENFLGVYFAGGAGSSAATAIAVGADGAFAGFVIVLDVDALAQRGANEWASWRENMPFASGAYRVAVRIADGAQDNRMGAIQFLLLHEIGHVLSAARSLIADWWQPLSWRIAEDGRHLSLDDDAFPQRGSLNYYGAAGLPSDALLPAYRALLDSRFFSMYAALSPDEDFAESFALYVHTELLQKPYFVRIFHEDKLLLQYATQWDEARFADKLAVLRGLLPDLATMARQAYGPLIGAAPLTRNAFGGGDMTPIAIALVARAEAYPDDANAYLDCSTVLQLTGDREIALQVQAEAIRLQPLFRLPPRAAPALRLLVVMGPGDMMANTPIEFLLEDSDVAVELLYLTADGLWPEHLPEHDVLMVGVAESDANQALLRRLAVRLAARPYPVLNRPERIAVLSRDGACAALADIDGVELPRTARVERAVLTALARQPQLLAALLPGDAFPLIVRPLGSHAGHDLEKIASAADLPDYLARVPAAQFYLARFVDYSGADGLFGKFRVALIDGRPFICHYAISSHWMVHYLNAGMDHSAEKRDTEARCMQDFDAGFAVRHGAALAEIHRRLDLPYLGIDCAETRDGRLLVFEVDNAMIVHAMDDPQRYAYKQPVMRKAFGAFRRLLQRFAPNA